MCCRTRVSPRVRRRLADMVAHERGEGGLRGRGEEDERGGEGGQSFFLSLFF